MLPDGPLYFKPIRHAANLPRIIVSPTHFHTTAAQTLPTSTSKKPMLMTSPPLAALYSCVWQGTMTKNKLAPL
jgi:hypothetical protein